MPSRIDREFAPLERALNLRAQRSSVLAGNIANADTPHYKARDFDFRAVMTDAARNADLRLAKTSTRHLDGADGDGRTPKLQYRHPVQPSIDGNTVELDAEIGRFSDNAIRYQASLTFMNGRIRSLMSAIQG